MRNLKEMATEPTSLSLTPSAPASSPFEPQAGAPERRRYAPPQLRHLGSVRDLTLGVRNGGTEPGMVGMMV